MSKYLNFSSSKLNSKANSWKTLKKNRTFATFYQSKKNCEGEEQSEKNCEGEEQTKKKCEGGEQRPNNEKIAKFRGGHIWHKMANSGTQK